MRLLLLLAVPVFLAAFPVAGHAASYSRLAGPTQNEGRYEVRNLSFSWNVKKGPAAVVVAGELKNIFYFVLTDVELRATAHDAAGKEVGKQAVHFVPGQLNPDEKAAFTLSVPVPPAASPKTIKILYKYRELEEDSYTEIPYYSTFEIPL